MTAFGWGMLGFVKNIVVTTKEPKRENLKGSFGPTTGVSTIALT
jgi:hypothetical protein